METTASTISILGCGWLGLAAGKCLVERGFTVQGSTTTEAKLTLFSQQGIRPFFISLTPEIEGDMAEFLCCDVLVIALPPGRKRPRGRLIHKKQIHNLIREVINSPVNRVIYISSTSVYNDNNRVVCEDDRLDPKKEMGRELAGAEQLLRERKEFETTVLRFSGLVGYDRQPGRFFAGKRDQPNAGAPVNLVHRDDGVAVICRVIAQERWGEVYNVCADRHPSREKFYTWHALRLGLSPPLFLKSGDVRHKIVSGDKLKRELGYRFRYPDPMEMGEG